jgi:cellulose biosynthesis protein BcsQ
VIVNRWERTVEHRRSVAELERNFGDGLTWQPYLPKRTALQDAARHGVPVHRLSTPAGRELADAVRRLTARMASAHATR